jgi:hypothetical protein
MGKYKFTEKYNFWNSDHIKNLNHIKHYFQHDLPSSTRLEFLEIGVFEGRTSCWLVDNILDGTMGMLYCIDPDITEKGKRNLCQIIGNMIFYPDRSIKILSEFLVKDLFKFDFIYVDGDHNATGVIQDLVLSWELLKVGGIMLMDDYEMEAKDPWFYVSHKEFEQYPKLRFTHPRIAIDAFLNIYRGQYEVVIDNYQIGVKKVVSLK